MGHFKFHLSAFGEDMKDIQLQALGECGITFFSGECLSTQAMLWSVLEYVHEKVSLSLSLTSAAELPTLNDCCAVLETLSIMAREMDEQVFTPAITQECIQLGISLIQHFDDPDVRRCW